MDCPHWSKTAGPCRPKPAPTSVRISPGKGPSQIPLSSRRPSMADNAAGLRIVGSEERPRPRRPGPAVLWILVYAGVFGAALLYLRFHSPWKKADGTPAGTAARAQAKPSRDALLTGAGVPRAAENRYFQRMSTERCAFRCVPTP